MNGAVDGVLATAATDHFHDVDLAAVRPAYLPEVAAQCPKGRPDALTSGKCSADINAAIGELNLSLGLDPRRGVITIAFVFTSGSDDQIAIGQGSIRPLVVLPLVVTPTRVTDVVIPIAAIEFRARKFI